MSIMDPLRVLHCPWNIGAHPATLAHFERTLGSQSWSVALFPSKFDFPADETLLEVGAGIFRQEQARLALLWRAARDFDVIHFNFGQSILHNRQAPVLNRSSPPTLRHRLFTMYSRALWMADLPILKALGKTIVITYQGDDARQGDYCRAKFPVTLAAHVDYYTPLTDEWKRRAIARAAQFADRIYALNPDLMHVLPSQAHFLPYANVDPSEWRPAGRVGNTKPLLVHAPTHRSAKGTSFVIDAVATLLREGIAFDFVLVEEMTRNEARTLYQRADLVIDQLLIGWYGGLAVECMALGKPVIAYIREEDIKFVPPEMARDLPVINAEPATLVEVLRHWLTVRRPELSDLGARSRRFIETWHDPAKIAASVLEDYRNLKNASA